MKKPLNWNQKKYWVCGIVFIIGCLLAFPLKATFSEWSIFAIGLVTLALASNTVDKKINPENKGVLLDAEAK